MIDGKVHLSNAVGVERRKPGCDFQPEWGLWLFIP